MTNGLMWCASGLLSMLLAGVLEVQAPPALDIKMGLWEVTSSAQIRGQIPIDTSQMTPEMKRTVEEAIKTVNGKTYTTVANKCIGKEWLAQWVVMGGPPAGYTCTQTPTINTPASLDVTITCTGESASVSQLHLDALSPTGFKGTMISANTGKGQTTTADLTFTGKWLSADCGSAK